MVLGTFFKTGFEKGLASHEQVVKQLLPLVAKPRKGHWPYHFAAQDATALPRRAGAALNLRLRMPGKDRRPCLPSACLPASALAMLLSKEGVAGAANERPPVYLSLAPAPDVAPMHAESAEAAWGACRETAARTATAFNGAFEIANESLSKEVLHRLAVPHTLRPGPLFLHDAALGSHPADDVKFTVVTHDPAAALFLRHMGNPVPQVDPVDFPHLISVFHVHDYAFADPKVIEEFNGVTPQQLGITSPRFVLCNLAERTAFVSGPTAALQEALLCLGSLVAFHLRGALVLNANAFVGTDGKLTVVFGSDEGLSKPSLYGAHHLMWSPNGISRAWDGVTTPRSQGAAGGPKYATDLLTPGAITTPLPLQLGGQVRPRGANALTGVPPLPGPEPLDFDPALPWRPNVVSVKGARFVFVGKDVGTPTVEEAAQRFAVAHATYPLGASTKKELAARFAALATEAGISCSFATAAP